MINLLKTLDLIFLFRIAQDSGNVKHAKHTEQPLPLPIQQKNCSINTG